MRETVRTANRLQDLWRRPEPGLSTAEIERMLVWVAGELRAERAFTWYRARRPYAFIRACPPGVN